MVSSAVGICNLTLDLLHQDSIQSIVSPTTATEELCSRWYDQVRREALRRHSWNFAAKRAQLAANATAPAFGFNTAFDLPSDYIRLMYITASSLDYQEPIPTKNFTIENGQVLIGGLTSVTESVLNIVYVSDFTEVTRMDASFIDYFVHLLGIKLAYPVTQSNSAVERLNSLMEKAEARARAMDGQENPPIRVERSRALAARRRRASSLDGVILFD